jgi:hypothetical protein
MFTDEMAKKVAAIYFNDIILYINKIENGYEELEPWIRKVITTNA